VDGLGRLTSVLEANGKTTAYTYDGLDNLIGVTQDTQQTCQIGSVWYSRCFAYSSLSRLTSARNPESGTVSYTYYPNGDLHTKTDARGATTTLAYDHLNRVTYKTYTGVVTPSVTYAYDVDTKGALSSVTTSDSATVYTHDKFGRVTGSTQTTAGITYPSLSYSYSLTDQLMSLTYPSGRTVSYTYDSADRVQSVSGYIPSQGITYMAAGGFKTVALANNRTETYSWNGRLQQTGISSGTDFELHFYPCDGGLLSCSENNGNIRRETVRTPGLPGTVTQEYGYDNLNRLTSAKEPANGSNWLRAFNYDGYGNMWVSSGSGVAVDPFTPQGSTWIDASTNRLQNAALPIAYDNVGNQTTIGIFSSAYDAENRLKTSTHNGITTTYTYDGEGRRVAKQVGGGTPTVYLYDAMGQLAAEYGSSPDTQCTTCFLTADHLGSTRMVTDGTGAVKALHDYLPFGEEIPAGVGNRSSLYGTDLPRQKFTGKERDSESGLDYFGARYNSSAQGRFTSPDPHTGTLLHVLNPQRWNMYTYAVNNPLSYVDPDGRDAIAVNFGNMAVGMGHWAIISVNRDGSATFSEFGPRGGAKPAYPGQYTSYDLATKITSPTPDILAAVQKELAQHEGQSQGSISLAYYKTSDAETASLNAYIQAAIQAQAKNNAPFYFVGFNDCRDYCLAGLHAAGITTSHYANLNLAPNFLFQFLESTANATYPSQPKKKKEKVDTKICYAGQPGCPVEQEQQK
jgi:RHS repeat-associated protein